MRILHTSDWHTGRKLKERSRLEEFGQFFAWLEDIIINEHIDALIVSGDIFDNTAPSPKAQELYYSFLGRLSNSPCRHAVIISGNHDSAIFIDAPSEIMKHCRVHVVGRTCDNPADEVITLTDAEGNPELIVCAVPYLHDKDIRIVKADDDPGDIERALKSGIMRHYAEVTGHARELRGASNVPIIAMGHLFLEHGMTLEDEGVRSLYVGTAVKVGTDIFPEDIAYTALGHLHSPQHIGRENIRYSGSPIAMTFGEASGRKSVSIVELEGRNFAGVREITVPVFQRLERLSGTIQEIENGIISLGHEGISVWLEVTYTGSEAIGDLQERFEDCAKVFPNIDILSVRDEGSSNIEAGGTGIFGGKSLDNVSPEGMFRYLMDSKDIPKGQRDVFMKMYMEILHGIRTGDNDTVQ